MKYTTESFSKVFTLYKQKFSSKPIIRHGSLSHIHTNIHPSKKHNTADLHKNCVKNRKNTKFCANLVLKILKITHQSKFFSLSKTVISRKLAFN